MVGLSNAWPRAVPGNGPLYDDPSPSPHFSRVLHRPGAGGTMKIVCWDVCSINLITKSTGEACLFLKMFAINIAMTGLIPFQRHLEAAVRSCCHLVFALGWTELSSLSAGHGLGLRAHLGTVIPVPISQMSNPGLTGLNSLHKRFRSRSYAAQKTWAPEGPVCCASEIPLSPSVTGDIPRQQERTQRTSSSFRELSPL